jgi:hypothetical protein
MEKGKGKRKKEKRRGRHGGGKGDRGNRNLGGGTEAVLRMYIPMTMDPRTDRRSIEGGKGKGRPWSTSSADGRIDHQRNLRNPGNWRISENGG